MEARVATVLLYVPEECREQCVERDGLRHQTSLPLKGRPSVGGETPWAARNALDAGQLSIWLLCRGSLVTL